ncbi:MAG TPA: zinc metallopeptidase [Oculatellaceae cyanobacterium]|jgi:Zn-dependent membrane protease YugP
MFFHDPAYMLVMLVGMVLVFVPQMWVKNTVGRYIEVPTGRRATGREVAQRILSEHGLSDVQVEMVQGELSDHYDPSAKAVRLSPDVYHGSSVASVAIAAHECGHAIQHAKGYVPVVLRSAMVPAVNIGSNLGPWLIVIALGLGATSQAMPQWSWTLAWLGVALYGTAVAFHFVTLPVELDASGRALKVLETQHFLSADEMSGAKKVLTAAAFTYVAAALYALIQLLYFVLRLLGSRREE